MKYKILSIILIIAISGALFWMIPIFKKRYFSENQKEPKILTFQDPSNSDLSNPQNENSQENPEGKEGENSQEMNEETKEVQIDVSNSESKKEDNVFANITPEHCNSKCKAFINSFEFFEYCEQVCGISPSKEVSASDCEDKKNLPRDYCFKDLAISKKDFSLCEKIKDSNVLRTCKNTITQNIIEGN
jgi:hypothetical protein